MGEAGTLYSEYVGRRIGGCEILRRVGAGGMGVVFEAQHLALGKRVALKILSPGLAADSKFVQRFVNEARLAAQIEHPNLVGIFNVGQDEDVHFIVMQFVEGRNLAEVMARGPLAPRDAAKIILQVARGLAAAHKRGIIHRDVKPENILVDREGVARIADMGLSKSLIAVGAPGAPEAAGLTAPGVAMGTPNYISPEQATEARLADARSDIYSLGATLYHALVGQPPFIGPSAFAIMNQHVSAPLPPAISRNPAVPPELDALVSRMMAKEPSARPQTMDEVVAELRKFLAAPGASAAAAATGPTVPMAAAVVKPAPARATWKFVALGAGGMLLALIVLGILGGAADPARKAFAAAQKFEREHPDDYAGCSERYAGVVEKFTGNKWAAEAKAAGAAVEKRLLEASGKAQADFEGRAAPLAQAGKWAEAEELWKGFPPQFKDTAAGLISARRADEARVARRASEIFAALAEGNVDRAVGYCDPRKDPGGARLVLGVFVALVKLGRTGLTELKIEKVELAGADKASLRMSFTVKPPDQPPARHAATETWELIKGEWYMIEHQKAPDESGPPKPRPGPGLRPRQP